MFSLAQFGPFPQQDCEHIRPHEVQPHIEVSLITCSAEAFLFDWLPLQSWGWISVYWVPNMLSQNTGKLSGNAERYQAPCHAPRPQNAMQTLMAVMMVLLQNGSDWDVTEPDTHKHTVETWSQRQIHSVRTDAHLKGSLTMRAPGQKIREVCWQVFRPHFKLSGLHRNQN